MADTDPPGPLKPEECREPTLEDLVKPLTRVGRRNRTFAPHLRSHRRAGQPFHDQVSGLIADVAVVVDRDDGPVPEPC